VKRRISKIDVTDKMILWSKPNVVKMPGRYAVCSKYMSGEMLLFSRTEIKKIRII